MTPATVTEIAQLELTAFDAGSLGLHLAEAKALLSRLQRTMVSAQVAEAVARGSVCPTCGAQVWRGLEQGCVSLASALGREGRGAEGSSRDARDRDPHALETYEVMGWTK
ncbi:hypothetical protein Tamer19_06990 [Cupriavidus sp. TA19]|nr:hypothetical protein Tamer19_06990 [Cupriavidus sp. TA19]